MLHGHPTSSYNTQISYDLLINVFNVSRVYIILRWTTYLDRRKKNPSPGGIFKQILIIR